MKDTPDYPRKKMIYVAGPIRAANSWFIEQNVRVAEAVTLLIWAMDGVAYCPHSQGRFFMNTLNDQKWLDGDMEFIRRGDAIFMLPHWRASKGSVGEYEFAKIHNIPIFESLTDLAKFLEYTGDIKQLAYDMGIERFWKDLKEAIG